MPKVTLAKMRNKRPRPDLPLDELDLNELIKRFNRAAINKAGKRKKDGNRHYLALPEKPITINTMIWVARQVFNFLAADLQAPSKINAETLAWEVITAVAKFQPEAVADLARHLLRELNDFKQAHRYYEKFIQLCGKTDPNRSKQENPIYSLIVGTMIRTAGSNRPDQDVLSALGLTPVS